MVGMVRSHAMKTFGRSRKAEMQKAADAADISVLFFQLVLILGPFWVIFGPIWAIMGRFGSSENKI